VTDVIVVGSGPGGVNAAAALVEAGCTVCILDYGNQDSGYQELVPKESFTEIRRSDPDQHRYFLGDRFEGVPLGRVGAGAQLTPPRMHVLADARERLPVDADAFSASLSLARGGLGAAWSAGVFPFVDDELEEMGLSLDSLQRHYDAVAERIGVCGERDDLEPFFPPSPSMMPALEVDSNAESILSRYRRQRTAFNAAGFFLGRPRIAACSKSYRGRGPHRYCDLAYWADIDRSIYRPQWTLDELARSDRFTYLDRRLVESFVEDENGVSVRVSHADSREPETHHARALVLAAGAMGSARIALRSLRRYDTPVPILCNPYSYVAMLNLGLFGRSTKDRRHSLGQLTAVLQSPEDSGLVQAQVFSYRSLLTFKLMKELPIGYADSRRILRLLVPYLAILGLHHEDRSSQQKVCLLRRGTGESPDRLEVRYSPSTDERRAQRSAERRLLGFFRRLGCLPLKAIQPGQGSSLHYAGTLPMRPSGGELSCAPDGRLRGTRAVYLGDGSVFPWLPAKGLTFTLAANADRVGTQLAERLR
jgi:choline dehydrogenase-like flavoprotein